MAKFYISEYVALAREGGNTLAPVPMNPPIAIPTPVVIGVGSLQSPAFNAATKFIRVHTDAICSVVIGGTNPIATVDSPRMDIGQTEYHGVKPGDKLAVIANT